MHHAEKWSLLYSYIIVLLKVNALTWKQNFRKVEFYCKQSFCLHSGLLTKTPGVKPVSNLLGLHPCLLATSRLPVTLIKNSTPLVCFEYKILKNCEVKHLNR